MKKIIIAASVLMLFSCKKEEKINDSAVVSVTENAESDSAQAVHIPATENRIKIEAFPFPAEVTNCSCYLSSDRASFEKEQYIYIDDYGNNAYLKLNGELVKIKMEEGDFDPENFSKEISGGDYKVKIQGRKIADDEEVLRFEGTMTVENSKGERSVTPIYGECGC